MSSGQRSGPVRRRKRRGKTSERASLIPKSTLSEIFSADDDSEDELELIDVEPEAPEPAAKRAPWWSVHPVPPPPRRTSMSPPPLRRPAVEPTPEVPPLDAVATPLSLLPPPVFEGPATDAPLVAASEASPPRDGSRFSVRLAAFVFVLGASVVFGLGLGRAPDAKSAASLPAATPPAAAPAALTAKPVEPVAPTLAPASTLEAAPSAEPVLSLDEVPPSSPSAAPSADLAAPAATLSELKPASAPAAHSVMKRSAAALPAFDSTVAANAISEAAQRAAACRAPTDPQGVAMVMLKYAPSGRVTTAVIEGGPFAGTTVGGCIAMAFRGAHVPAFAGEPVTVRKNVTYP